jgi:glutamate--cysteine ligase
VLTREQMLATFAPQKRPYRHLVGFEYEIICLDPQTLRPLQYEGPHGLRALLEAAARHGDGELLEVDGDFVSKVKLPDGGLLSLEPGGQLEFSSAPRETFQGALDQFSWFLGLLEHLKRQHPLHYFYGGLEPVHTVDEIGLVTRSRRYQIMNDYFPRVGKLGRRMMRQSCSIQISFDFDERLKGHDLLRTAMYVAPFAGALLANSPYVDGKPTGYCCYRVPIWADTDPARSGPLAGFTRQDYGFEDYLDHVLAAPMFFVQTPEGMVDAGGMTFDTYLRRGFHGQQASYDDFLTHNSTIFNDVRLKNTVEVRTVDAQDPALLPSVLALLCGILHCERARLRSRLLLGRYSETDYRELTRRLAREGIGGELGGGPVRETLLQLIDLAAMGLPNCFPDGDEAADHLEPLRQLARAGLTPADVVLRRHGDRPEGWLRAGRTFDATPGEPAVLDLD